MSDLWQAALTGVSDRLSRLPSWLPPLLFQTSDGFGRKLAQLVSALLLSSNGARQEREWLRWCGKHYEVGSPVDNPGGQWIEPELSKVPLLDFRCIPAEQPYLETDDAGALIIDVSTSRTHGQPIFGLAPGDTFAGDLLVTVWATPSELDSSDPQPLLLASTTIAAPVHSLELTFDLASMRASSRPYELSCSARPVAESSRDRTFTASSTLRFLPPNPYGGSTVKLDRRTGGLLAKQADGWRPVIPTGFYTVFLDYVEANHSIMDDMVAMGFNTMHVIPPDGRVESIIDVLRYAESAGLYIMLDLRHAYFDPKLVAEAAITMRSSKSLLLWYTADEPDGTQDLFGGVTAAYDQLYALDGYHPVSLVLNCGDYHFAEYTKGTDIVLVDTYPFNVDTQLSSEYGTVCNATYGCCGCDNCFAGDPFLDIANRLDQYDAMRAGLGRERNLTIWAVPQAFAEAFWSDLPTAAEFQAGAVLSLIHGAKGILPWNAPTSAAINTTFSALAQHLSNTLTALVLSPSAARSSARAVVLAPPDDEAKVQARAWVDDETAKVLVLIVNLSREPTAVRLAVVVDPNDEGRTLPRVDRAIDLFDREARVRVKTSEEARRVELVGKLGPLGTGAWLLADE